MTLGEFHAEASTKGSSGVSGKTAGAQSASWKAPPPGVPKQAPVVGHGVGGGAEPQGKRPRELGSTATEQADIVAFVVGRGGRVSRRCSFGYRPGEHAGQCKQRLTQTMAQAG
ncbi:MAG: hypothetical protein GY772_05515, partial [bacterium]|nr:hypothetical protein [bacterium]